ncbi:copper chaperone PCu(A)C [Acetobacter sp. TBRC 12305]|uniref:Copper chaperone PCu(A)C n=2 Tax=Acetobacter garciniae TaxID=2817435 RepID=A0A939HNI3_9PROT|nr:copper chaperone PCu(A)C [Acetobacter garciniae]MBX0343933.1 copper chaperone PCu(A)C [Acetobacter garciniae]
MTALSSLAVTSFCARAQAQGPAQTEGPPAAQADTTNVPGQDNAQKDIVVSRAALALPSGHGVPQLYFTIKNTGATAHLLSGISSTACRHMIGHHADQEGTEATRDLFTHLALPAGMTLVFSAGGYNLLCFGASPDLHATQNVQVTFSFLGGSSQNVQVPVVASTTPAD